MYSKRKVGSHEDRRWETVRWVEYNERAERARPGQGTWGRLSRCVKGIELPETAGKGEVLSGGLQEGRGREWEDRPES